MQTHQLRSNISYFLRNRERFEPFLKPLSELATYANLALGLVQGIAVGSTGMSSAANQVHQTLASTSTALKNVNHRNFFLVEKDFLGELEDLWSEGDEDLPTAMPEWSTQLTQRIEEFGEVYNIFLSEQSGANAFPVLLAAQELQTAIDTSFRLLEGVLEALASHEKPVEGETSFSLYLPSEMSLRDFIKRLEAFQNMYSILCGLLKVNEHDRPLRTVEIESGSLWLKFFGDSKVLGFLTSLIEKGVSWGFRNFTPEGRLGAIPRKVESVEAVFNLTQKLKAAGIEVDGADENVKIATAQIAKDLATLIAGQSMVTVNHTTITLKDELMKQRLEEATKFPALDYDVEVPPPTPQLPPPKSDGSR